MVLVPFIEPAVNISLFGGSSMPSTEDKESEYESGSRSPTTKPCEIIIMVMLIQLYNSDYIRLPYFTYLPNMIIFPPHS